MEVEKEIFICNGCGKEITGTIYKMPEADQFCFCFECSETLKIMHEKALTNILRRFVCFPEEIKYKGGADWKV